MARFKRLDGYQVRFLTGTDEHGSKMEQTAAGLGITALPRLTMPLLGRLDLVWRRLEHPVMRRQIGVVTQSRRSLAPAALAFLAVLEQQARIHG